MIQYYRKKESPGRSGSSRRRCRINRWLLLTAVFFSISMVSSGVNGQAQPAEQGPSFRIQSFIIEGNTILTEKKIHDLLKRYVGSGKTASDVEQARNGLEKVYHDSGYPAVLVNIPEQTVTEGTIRLQVIESKIGIVRVTGNKWYTREKILRDLPSLSPGKILYAPMVQKDLERASRSQDIKLAPILSPGKELGLTDVEIKVEDRLPLHGSVELNNLSTHDTSDQRLSAMLRYDNLWQRDHSISIQYQISPQKTEEVELYGLSYVLPAPWNVDHHLAFYGVKSDSNTTITGTGYRVSGKGTILGTRYVIPLPPYDVYAHNVTAGVDYKDFTETVGANTAAGAETPITYAPLSISYNSSLPDAWGMTRFSGGLNVAFRGLVTDQEKFEVKRSGARGNYMYLTAGIERNQKLPAGMGLFLKLDGQIADQPLISNEQYAGGGMMNVRGYREAEALGDDAFHGTAEVSAPDLGSLMGWGKYFMMTPFVFYDYAWLHVKRALDLQDDVIRLRGTGAGIRGTVRNCFYYELMLGFPLADTDKTDKYHERWHFKVGVQF